MCERREAGAPYQRWVSQGLLRYVDQKKFPALFEAVAGRQLPSTALQNKPGTKRTLTERNHVGQRNVNQEAGSSGAHSTDGGQ